MDVKTKIEIARLYKKMSKSELAKRLDMSPQAFGQKLERQSFTIEELYKIAEAMEVKFEYHFEFEDGTKI